MISVVATRWFCGWKGGGHSGFVLNKQQARLLASLISPLADVLCVVCNHGNERHLLHLQEDYTLFKRTPRMSGADWVWQAQSSWRPLVQCGWKELAKTGGWDCCRGLAGRRRWQEVVSCGEPDWGITAGYSGGEGDSLSLNEYITMSLHLVQTAKQMVPPGWWGQTLRYERALAGSPCLRLSASKSDNWSHDEGMGWDGGVLWGSQPADDGSVCQGQPHSAKHPGSCLDQRHRRRSKDEPECWKSQGMYQIAAIFTSHQQRWLQLA